MNLAIRQVIENDFDAQLERKREWVMARTEQIMADNDYCIELLNEVHTDHPYLFLDVLRCQMGNAISVLAELHSVTTRYARRMAESEASVRRWS